MKCFWFSHYLRSWVWKINFVIFFGFHSIRLSLSHDLDNRFRWVAQVFFEVALLFISFFLKYFLILSFKILFFLKLSFTFFLVFPSIGLFHSHNLTREFWRPHSDFGFFVFKTSFYSLIFFYLSTFELLGISNRYFSNFLSVMLIDGFFFLSL